MLSRSSYEVAPDACQLRFGVVVTPAVPFATFGEFGVAGTEPLDEVNVIDSKLPPPESITSRAICAPASSATNRVSVCHVCQPPVFGTDIGPVTLLPFISRWNVPPPPAEATRKPTV